MLFLKLGQPIHHYATACFFSLLKSKQVSSVIHTWNSGGDKGLPHPRTVQIEGPHSLFKGKKHILLLRHNAVNPDCNHCIFQCLGQMFQAVWISHKLW